MNSRIFFFLIVLFPLFSFAQSANLPYTIFLVGDAGEPLSEGAIQNMNLLKEQLELSNENSVLIYLGDNIYPRGLPKPGHEQYEEAKNNLDGLLAPLENYSGLPIFIPGNHDWQQGGEDGWNRVKNQQRYVEKALGSNLSFSPDRGCGGPVEIELMDDLILVLFDSQWLLHKEAKPGRLDGCVNANDKEFFGALEDVLNRHSKKKILVAAHHPVYTYGIHGGSTTLKNHIFPLTEMKKGLYIPLPVIGSLYPIYRKYFGNIQDTKNPRYTEVKDRLENIFQKHPNIIYAAGHEHSLQYSFKDDVHYVVSGSGSKVTHVKKRGYAQYVKESRGFVKVVYKQDGSIDLEYWVSGESSDGHIDKTISIR